MSAQLTGKVILVRPANFSFNKETAASNAFQNPVYRLSHEEVLARVTTEFDGFVRQLTANGVEVTVLRDTSEPSKPDAIFPNNWISMHSDGTVVLYPMQAENRRTERRLDLIVELRKKHMVKEVRDLSPMEEQEIYLEGTGSIVFDHINKVAYACYSPRTNRDFFESVVSDMGYRPVGFDAVDIHGQAIYHTNVMMGIGEGFAVVCLDCIPDSRQREQLVRSLEEGGLEIIPITQDQIARFAGNVLALRSATGEQLLVLSKSAFETLTEGQRLRIERYARCVAMNIPTIEAIGGGSARCMIAEVFLPLR